MNQPYRGNIAYPLWRMAARPKSPPCSRPSSPLKFSDTHYRDEDTGAGVRQQHRDLKVQVQLRRRGQEHSQALATEPQPFYDDCREARLLQDNATAQHGVQAGQDVQQEV